MKDPQIFEFYEHKQQQYQYMHEDVFKLQPKGKMVWLQKACFWILGKLGAQWWEEKMTVTRHRIDTKLFMDRIFKQRRNLVNFFGHHGGTLIIGSEDFAEMMGEPEMQNAIDFNASYMYNDGNQPRIMGLKVKVIPWFRGAVVI